MIRDLSLNRLHEGSAENNGLPIPQTALTMGCLSIKSDGVSSLESDILTNAWAVSPKEIRFDQDPIGDRCNIKSTESSLATGSLSGPAGNNLPFPKPLKPSITTTPRSRGNDKFCKPSSATTISQPD